MTIPVKPTFLYQFSILSTAMILLCATFGAAQPAGGTINVSTFDGEASATSFMFSAPGWNTLNPPLEYQFAINDVHQTDAFTPTGPFSAVNNDSRTLPVGAHAIQVTVRDGSGSTATAMLTVLAYPADATTNVKHSNETGGGDLQDGLTWSDGAPPTAADTLVIRSGDIVTMTANAQVDRIFIETGGTLDIGDNTLFASEILNNGIILENNGAIDLVGDFDLFGDLIITLFRTTGSLRVGRLSRLSTTGDVAVVGSISNLGIIRHTDILDTPDTYEMGATEATINLVDEGTLTTVTVQQIYDERIIPNTIYWNLEPEGVAAAFEYDLELPLMDVAGGNARLCQIDIDGVTETGVGCDVPTIAGDFATRASLTNMSDWAIFPASVLPVELSSFGVE